jgi:hypothetical protein
MTNKETGSPALDGGKTEEKTLEKKDDKGGTTVKKTTEKKP